MNHIVSYRASLILDNVILFSHVTKSVKYISVFSNAIYISQTPELEIPIQCFAVNHVNGGRESIFSIFHNSF